MRHPPYIRSTEIGILWPQIVSRMENDKVEKVIYSEVIIVSDSSHLKPPKVFNRVEDAVKPSLSLPLF